MPEFILDTSGAIDRPANYKGFGVDRALTWVDLDAFTQGYIEAMFFTGIDGGAADYKDGDFVEANGKGFADLAPEALANILKDCQSFKLACVHVQPLMGEGDMPDEAQAGRDFWYTRNGHGCGFWDGDWPEPWADDLTQAAKAFGEVDAYLGDDGKVYLS